MIAADLIHRVSNADADGEGAVDVSLAIAYGLNLGAKAQPLLAQRWEEGGRTPLDHWRERLRIRSLQHACTFPMLAGEAVRE